MSTFAITYFAIGLLVVLAAFAVTLYKGLFDGTGWQFVGFLVVFLLWPLYLLMIGLERFVFNYRRY